LPRHGHRFLRGGKIAIDDEHFRSLLSEAQHGGAAVADALARRLAGAHHDGDLVLETHGVLDSIDAALKLTEIRRRTRASRATLHRRTLRAKVNQMTPDSPCTPSRLPLIAPEEAHDQPPQLHRAPCRHGRSP